jgi:hypothetical protein
VRYTAECQKAGLRQTGGEAIRRANSDAASSSSSVFAETCSPPFSSPLAVSYICIEVAYVRPTREMRPLITISAGLLVAFFTNP